MKLWPLLLLLLVCVACKPDGVVPCRTDLVCTAYVDAVEFRDSLELGDRITLVMDFFPQDSRGKIVIAPLDYKYEWGMTLKRSNIPFSSQPDTLTFQVEAALGEIKEIRPDVIRVVCARNGNMQQARISFSVMKPGLYTLDFFDGRTWAELGEWGKCKTYLSFSKVDVVQTKGLYPRTSGYTFYVKS